MDDRTSPLSEGLSLSCKDEVNLQQAEGRSPRNYFVTYHQGPNRLLVSPTRDGGTGGGTVHPIVAYTGRLHQKSAFFMLQVYERIAISALEVNRKGREICHFSL